MVNIINGQYMLTGKSDICPLVIAYGYGIWKITNLLVVP
jgi:hypothetical protein